MMRRFAMAFPRSHQACAAFYPSAGLLQVKRDSAAPRETAPLKSSTFARASNGAQKEEIPVRILVLFCLFACLASARAAPSPEASDPGTVRIRVEGGGWGDAGAEQIEPVLQAVAAELLVKLPNKLTAPIVVTHTEGNPIALYERRHDGAYQVRLHASGTRWHLYVFEFAHEFCHLLSNHDRHVPTSGGRHNQWFEESVCETASLFALDRLASRWEQSPPVPEWKERAPKLRRFYEILAGEEHRRLPPGTAPAAWLKAEEEQLRGNPYLRKKNDLIAKLLLPLFQREPKSWEAISYMNLDPDDSRASLAGYLRHWHDNAPAAHKAFVSAVRGLLGHGDEAPAAVAADAGDAKPHGAIAATSSAR
jgi:hypothetical protein